jgi:hypothetical protein
MSRHHGNVDFAEEANLKKDEWLQAMEQFEIYKHMYKHVIQRGGHFLVMMSNDGRQWRKLSRDEILVSPDKNYMHVYVHKRYGKGGIY